MISRLAFAAALAAISTQALALDRTVKVVVAGQAYEGPPEFTVTFNGVEIGTGQVDKARASEAGMLDASSDLAPFTQEFTFTVPENVFKPDGRVQVTFTNDLWSGPEKGYDRNLIVQSIAVDGQVVDTDALEASVASAKPRWNNGLLPGTGDAVIAKPSAGGWGEAETDIALAAAQPTSAVASPPLCTGNLLVPSFPVRASTLSAEQQDAIKTFLETQSVTGCTLSVTGYASTGGDAAVNQLASEERAKAVSDYLASLGVDEASIKTIGGGATQQFGARAIDNRRAVIEVLSE